MVYAMKISGNVRFIVIVCIFATFIHSLIVNNCKRINTNLPNKIILFSDDPWLVLVAWQIYIFQRALGTCSLRLLVYDTNRVLLWNGICPDSEQQTAKSRDPSLNVMQIVTSWKNNPIITMHVGQELPTSGNDFVYISITIIHSNFRLKINGGKNSSTSRSHPTLLAMTWRNRKQSCIAFSRWFNA